MKICVLGCGPAGALTALGLKELGYQVTVIGEIRPYPVTEGISARVCQALVDNGLQCALAQVSAPVTRYACWNGQDREANTECLVYRPDFDQALLADLSRRGISVVGRRIRARSRRDGRWLIELDQTSSGQDALQADFVVEARGRAAGYAGKARLRGPETVSVACRWEAGPGAAFSAVAAVEAGWLWLARHDNGQLYGQYTTHAKNPDLSPKQQIPQLLDDMLDKLQLPKISLSRREAVGEPVARSSTAILPEASAEEKLLRVGDAAMAVDPLSGNGIFQSLSSALAAPAVINTVLQRPADGELALSFYRDRLRHLFFRFARVGRDFYALEERWPDRDFWRLRAQWPDEKPVHASTDRVIGREARPVIHHGFIEERQVVVTEDQPLGAAHVPQRNNGV